MDTKKQDSVLRTGNRVNVRLAAVRALLEINRDGGYANIVLQQYISQYHFTDVDRRFFTELVYGVIRRRNYLDAMIIKLTGRPIKKLSAMVVEILRLGLYQLWYLDRVPHSAAVNESVKLARKLTRGLHGFVNGVLRNSERRREELSIEAMANSEAQRWSYVYNQPEWLIQRWLSEYGEDTTLGLLSWCNDNPALIARVNTLVATPEEVVSEMEKAGWRVEQSTKIPEALRILSHRGSLEAAKWVKEGSITFMDEASMAVAYVVQPKPGDKVLDCCAAPGGKTMHMAALMQNQGAIVANDIHSHKIELMKQNAQRLHVSIVSFYEQDATTLPESYDNVFDKVLVDAPCSGLGILQKKPDMRWRKEEKAIDALPELQGRILERAAKAVKTGGHLIYSTCTINKAENEGVVTTFLKEHPEFIIEDAATLLPFETKGPMVTLMPHKDEMDGFFIARMRKEVL